MNEAQWLSSRSAVSMLDSLMDGRLRRIGKSGTARRPSGRKLRLFAVACARHHLSQSHPSLAGRDDYEALAEAEAAADSDGPTGIDAAAVLSSGVVWACLGDPATAADTWAASAGAVPADDVLREILGNRCRPATLGPEPIRPGTLLTMVNHPEYRMAPAHAGDPVHAMATSGVDDDGLIEVAPAGAKGSRARWPCPRTTLTPDAVMVATSIYERRAFDELPALADALVIAGVSPAKGRTRSQVVEARTHAVTGGCCDRFADQQGCDCLEKAEPDGVIEHLLSPGPHFLGCWALDLILGKE